MGQTNVALFVPKIVISKKGRAKKISKARLARLLEVPCLKHGANK